MKLFRWPVYCFCVSLILIVFQGCATFKTYEISQNYNKPAHKRVGLLVCRMGNRVYTGVSIITLKTNYAIRASKPQSTMSLSDNFVDVYIDDDARLRQSLPDYPKYMPASLSNIGSLRKEEAAYFKNISPQIYNSVAELLKKKEYEVIDVRDISRGWEKPFSEMTVDEILTKLRDSVDSLVIFHYMDAGDFYLYAVTVERKDTGFSFLSYTVSMFDTATKERLLFFRPLFPYSINAALMNDPEIREKFKKDESSQAQGLGVANKTSAAGNISEEEVIQRVLKYLCYGVKYRDDTTNLNEEWRGLDNIVP